MTSYCHKSLKKKKIGKNTQASIMYRAHAIQNKTTYSVFSSRSWFFEKRKSSSRPKTVICPQLHQTAGASLVAEMAKSLPAVQETQVRSLGPEDPLEKGMAAHSSIPAWKIPQTEEPSGLQSTGSRKRQTQLSH